MVLMKGDDETYDGFGVKEGGWAVAAGGCAEK